MVPAFQCLELWSDGVLQLQQQLHVLVVPRFKRVELAHEREGEGVFAIMAILSKPTAGAK